MEVAVVASENYYDHQSLHPPPLFYNVRNDPFESYKSVDSKGHLAQRNGWLFEPTSDVNREHLKTFANYPPVHSDFSADFSTMVPDYLR